MQVPDPSAKGATKVQISLCFDNFPPPPVVGLRFKLYKNKGFFFAEKKFFVFLSIATARRRRAAQQLARARARAR